MTRQSQARHASNNGSRARISHRLKKKLARRRNCPQGKNSSSRPDVVMRSSHQRLILPSQQPPARKSFRSSLPPSSLPVDPSSPSLPASLPPQSGGGCWSCGERSPRTTQPFVQFVGAALGIWWRWRAPVRFEDSPNFSTYTGRCVSYLKPARNGG